MWFFYLTVVLLIFSFFTDRIKTKQSLLKAYQKFKFIALSFLVMLILVSIILYILPEGKIVNYLNNSHYIINIITAALVGSVTIMPGFVVFPLAGILKNSGILYTVIAAFTTTLMMVGFVTFPIEAAYFGKKITFIRNIISFVIAIIVALAIGIYFKEISI